MLGGEGESLQRVDLVGKIGNVAAQPVPQGCILGGVPEDQPPRRQPKA